MTVGLGAKLTLCARIIMGRISTDMMATSLVLSENVVQTVEM